MDKSKLLVVYTIIKRIQPNQIRTKSIRTMIIELLKFKKIQINHQRVQITNRMKSIGKNISNYKTRHLIRKENYLKNLTLIQTWDCLLDDLKHLNTKIICLKVQIKPKC